MAQRNKQIKFKSGKGEALTITHPNAQSVREHIKSNLDVVQCHIGAFEKEIESDKRIRIAQ